MVSFFFTGAWQPSLLHCVPWGVPEWGKCQAPLQKPDTHAQCAPKAKPAPPTPHPPSPMAYKLLSPPADRWVPCWEAHRGEAEQRTGCRRALARCGSPFWKLSPTVLPGDHNLPPHPFSNQYGPGCPCTNPELLPDALRQIFSRPFLRSALGTYIKLSFVTFQDQFWGHV